MYVQISYACRGDDAFFVMIFFTIVLTLKRSLGPFNKYTIMIEIIFFVFLSNDIWTVRALFSQEHKKTT